MRVCRPGGQVAVLEFSQPALAPFRAVYGWYFRNVLPRIGQALRATGRMPTTTCRRAWASFPPARPWPSDARGRAARCRYYPLTLGVATLYVGAK